MFDHPDPLSATEALSNRRSAVDKSQAALERAHSDLASQKGRLMRLLSDVEDANNRIEQATAAIAQAENAMQRALAGQPPAPVNLTPNLAKTFAQGVDTSQMGERTLEQRQADQRAGLADAGADAGGQFDQPGSAA